MNTRFRKHDNIDSLNVQHKNICFCIKKNYKLSRKKAMIKIRVADPDPSWIQIQWGQWIRIRIRNQDPGGQK
jgi:hypothetical protein